jgi:hypothetical protein
MGGFAGGVPAGGMNKAANANDYMLPGRISKAALLLKRFCGMGIIPRITLAFGMLLRLPVYLLNYHGMEDYK